ncbi:hypothetical protein ACFX2F_035154 [Malus domestica]
MARGQVGPREVVGREGLGVWRTPGWLGKRGGDGRKRRGAQGNRNGPDGNLRPVLRRGWGFESTKFLNDCLLKFLLPGSVDRHLGKRVLQIILADVHQRDCLMELMELRDDLLLLKLSVEFRVGNVSHRDRRLALAHGSRLGSGYQMLGSQLQVRKEMRKDKGKEQIKDYFHSLLLKFITKGGYISIQHNRQNIS